MGNAIRSRTATRLAALGLITAAAIACGAAGAQGDRQGGKGKGGPLSPTTYDPRQSLAPLVQKVSPAVVNIKVTSRRPRPGSPFGPDLFEFFFGPGLRDRQPVPEPRALPESRAVGSGFVIDSSGLVVTNHHVVAAADEIEVQLADERTFPADLVGSDERTDVALLQLRDARGLPTVAFGDSDRLAVGDHVVAIGNPFGLDHTVTSGIVSAKARVIGAGPYDDFIQTDASINPGNSGGPLFNLRGEVVGINTAIAPQGQGIGFAIPSNLARALIDSLRDRGKVVRGWLGIAFQPLDEALAAAVKAPDARGALVANVTPGGPADKAGMKTGDVIVAVDGKPLTDVRRLPALVAGLEPGRTVPVEVLRTGAKRTLRVRVGEIPGEEAAAGKPGKPAPPGSKAEDPDTARLGFEVGVIDARLRARLKAGEVDGGVVVTRVTPGSAAASKLRRGDIVVEAGGKRVRDPAGFAGAVADLKAGDDLLLLVFRGGNWLYVVIRL
jgi:serine protease Do